jgi:hypothetical protein
MNNVLTLFRSRFKSSPKKKHRQSWSVLKLSCLLIIPTISALPKMLNGGDLMSRESGDTDEGNKDNTPPSNTQQQKPTAPKQKLNQDNEESDEDKENKPPSKQLKEEVQKTEDPAKAAAQAANQGDFSVQDCMALAKECRSSEAAYGAVMSKCQGPAPAAVEICKESHQKGQAEEKKAAEQAAKEGGIGGFLRQHGIAIAGMLPMLPMVIAQGKEMLGMKGSTALPGGYDDGYVPGDGSAGYPDDGSGYGPDSGGSGYDDQPGDGQDNYPDQSNMSDTSSNYPSGPSDGSGGAAPSAYPDSGASGGSSNTPQAAASGSGAGQSRGGGRAEPATNPQDEQRQAPRKRTQRNQQGVQGRPSRYPPSSYGPGYDDPRAYGQGGYTPETYGSSYGYGGYGSRPPRGRSSGYNYGQPLFHQPTASYPYGSGKPALNRCIRSCFDMYKQQMSAHQQAMRRHGMRCPYPLPQPIPRRTRRSVTNNNETVLIKKPGLYQRITSSSKARVQPLKSKTIQSRKKTQKTSRKTSTQASQLRMRKAIDQLKRDIQQINKDVQRITTSFKRLTPS